MVGELPFSKTGTDGVGLFDTRFGAAEEVLAGWEDGVRGFVDSKLLLSM